jgi:triphosphoribosyl-dephospho-CoA synthase
MATNVTEHASLSIGMCAQLACILDVASFKPGNVSIAHGQEDMTFVDFLLSAAAIAPIMEQAPFQPIGQTILDSIRATRSVTNANTNLGIVLLLAPLASVPPKVDLKGGLMRALIRLTIEDAKLAYEAIRLAQPGGLGTVEQQDVSQEPTVTLREAMALASNRDMIARQYVNDFEQVFEGVEILRDELEAHQKTPSVAITYLFLRLLAKYPDTLIARKEGIVDAKLVSELAERVLKNAAGSDQAFLTLPGRQLVMPPPHYFKNPGATADVVTASLFVALRKGMIELPFDPPFRANFLDH